MTTTGWWLLGLGIWCVVSVPWGLFVAAFIRKGQGR